MTILYYRYIQDSKSDYSGVKSESELQIIRSRLEGRKVKSVQIGKTLHLKFSVSPSPGDRIKCRGRVG